MSEAKASLDAKLERLADMKSIAKSLLDECDTGEITETCEDADVAIESAIDLAERLIEVAKGRA